MTQARSTSPTPNRLRRWPLAGLAICLAAGLPLAGFIAQQPTTGGDLQSFTDQLDRDEARWLAATEVRGASVALVRDGKVVWGNGYGHADEARGLPVTADTVFHTGSISKPVTAWGVLRLVEQGRLDLDVPVETYLTRWHLPASPFDSDGVTVRRLLSHSAGLSSQDYSYLSIRPLPSLEESLAGESGGDSTRSGRDDVRITMEPGQQRSYSNGGFTILQLVIEEVTGESFSAYMQREVLDPLAMSSSTFQWRPDMRASTAIEYDDAERPMPNSLITERAAGGLYSTATDMARFMAAGMPGPDGEAPGRGVLTPETFSLMTTDFTLPDHMRASLGYEVETLDGATGIGHGGSNTGTSTQFLTLPDRGEGIVVLSNSRDYAVTGVIMQAWGAWQGTGSPNIAVMLEQDLESMATTFLILAGLLTAGVLGWGGYLLRGGVVGRRTWLWRSRATTRGTWSWIGRASALALTAAAGVTGWLMPWRDLIASFIPTQTHLLTVAVMLSCLAGAATALTTRTTLP